MKKNKVGLIGLAVMGQNLVLNLADKGYSVSVFNRTEQKTKDFKATSASSYENVVPFYDLKDFIASLERPRKVILMVKAGTVVDAFLKQIIPLLEAGDVVMDGGNSHFEDSQNRCDALEQKGIHYLGCGISGGEEGARNGPSIMPGGSPKAWTIMEEMLKAIAAKTKEGEPCCQWIGKGGAGHYVKMVHNAIEYADMQIITEGYEVLRDVYKKTNEEMATLFEKWNEKSELSSYLIEITAQILRYKENDQSSTIDKILDTSQQKGTGKWTSTDALGRNIAIPAINSAVVSRLLSSYYEDRQTMSALFQDDEGIKQEWTKENEEILKGALLCGKILAYNQGFHLLRKASHDYNWELNLGNIALTWREGCIIRSAFLGDIKSAYENNPQLNMLIENDFFKNLLMKYRKNLTQFIKIAAEGKVSVLALGSSLNYYFFITKSRSGANLIQAQRDFFGAHTYEKVGAKRGEFFHTNWIGSEGAVSSTTYSV